MEAKKTIFWCSGMLSYTLYEPVAATTMVAITAEMIAMVLIAFISGLVLLDDGRDGYKQCEQDSIRKYKE